MIRLNGVLILSLITCVVSCKPENPTQSKEELQIYDEALDQIITEYFMSECLLEKDSAFAEHINEAFHSGKIDSSRYYNIGDSLFVHRKTQLTKCIMEYRPLFFAPFSAQKTEVQSYMTFALQDDFYNKYFSDIPMTEVIDTVLQNTTFDWETISLPYMNFIAHVTTEKKYQFGKEGIAVIALSKIYFNPKADHAILFFEFKSSPHYQRGEIMFLEKNSGHWKTTGFRNIWIS